MTNSKRPRLEPGREVVLGNCGGYLNVGGHEGDEFMLGAGFKQSNEFMDINSEEEKKKYR